MLAVERKKTDKVDISKPIETYINENFGEALLFEHQDALKNLQQLREDIRNIQDKSEHARLLLFRYYDMCCSLEFRFPITEDNIRIQFGWYDPFRQKKTAQYSIYYEKICVLFNIGAISSGIAQSQNRSSPEGMKLANALFQEAAGVFDEVKNYLQVHPEVIINELSTECLEMLVNLMLAQAQECFYEKASKDGMKHLIVSKLASGVANFYDITAKSLEGNTNKSLIDKSWAATCETKFVIYTALTYYHLAENGIDKGLYGERVARLQKALDLLNESKRKLFTRHLPLEVKDLFENTLSTMDTTFKQAEKENDTIYHEQIPSEDKMVPVERKAMVSAKLPLQMKPEYQNRDPDSFTRLVPFAVRQAASIYSERKDGLVREEQSQLEDQNEIAKGSLASMNLPGAIEALETPDGIPGRIKEYMQILRNEGGGVSYIEDLIETLTGLHREDTSLLDEALSILDKEEAEDTEMRNHYQGKWLRTPSHTLTSNLRQEAAKFSGHIDHADKSNKLVLKKYEDIKLYLDMLGQNEETLLANLPSNTNSQTIPPEIINGLKQSLGMLDRVVAIREQLKNELTQISQNDDISGQLVNRQTSEHEQIFENQLLKYQDVQNRLRGNFQEQENLLSRISEQNENFNQIRQANDAGAKRDEMINKLGLAFKTNMELKANLNEGIQFYINLQEMVSKFRTKCTDFSFARKTEKQDILNQLQIENTGLASTNLPQPSMTNPQIAAPTQQLSSLGLSQYQPQFSQQPQYTQNQVPFSSAPQNTGQPQYTQQPTQSRPAQQYVQPTQPGVQPQQQYTQQPTQNRPTQQYVQPTQPGVQPQQQYTQQPTQSRPAQQYVQPTQPGVQPQQYTQQPTQNRPAQQYVQPTQPGVQPQQYTQQPTQSRPAQQYVQPTQPGVQPQQQYMQPNQQQQFAQQNAVPQAAYVPPSQFLKSGQPTGQTYGLPVGSVPGGAPQYVQQTQIGQMPGQSQPQSNQHPLGQMPGQGPPQFSSQNPPGGLPQGQVQFNPYQNQFK